MSYEKLPDAYICRDRSIYPRPFITRRARVIVKNNFKTDENGNYVFDNLRLTEVANPQKHDDAANKTYVDNAIQQTMDGSAAIDFKKTQELTAKMWGISKHTIQKIL